MAGRPARCAAPHRGWQASPLCCPPPWLTGQPAVLPPTLNIHPHSTHTRGPAQGVLRCWQAMQPKAVMQPKAIMPSRHQLSATAGQRRGCTVSHVRPVRPQCAVRASLLLCTLVICMCAASALTPEVQSRGAIQAAPGCWQGIPEPGNDLCLCRHHLPQAHPTSQYSAAVLGCNCQLPP
jgi:hypothetical protein